MQKEKWKIGTGFKTPNKNSTICEQHFDIGDVRKSRHVKSWGREQFHAPVSPTHTMLLQDTPKWLILEVQHYFRHNKFKFTSKPYYVVIIFCRSNICWYHVGKLDFFNIMCIAYSGVYIVHFDYPPPNLKVYNPKRCKLKASISAFNTNSYFSLSPF